MKINENNIEQYISSRKSSFDIELKILNPLEPLDDNNDCSNNIIKNDIIKNDISKITGFIEGNNIIYYENILHKEYSFFNCFSKKYYKQNQSKIKIIRKCLYPTILLIFLLFIENIRNIIYIPFIFGYTSLIFFWNNPNLLVIPVKKPLYINEIFDYNISNTINKNMSLSTNSLNELNKNNNIINNKKIKNINTNNELNDELNNKLNDDLNNKLNNELNNELNNNKLIELQKILLNIYLRDKYSKILKWSLIITHSITISLLSDFWFYKTSKINNNVIEILGISGGIIKILQLINKILSNFLLKIIFYFLKKEYKKQKMKLLLET